MGFGNKNVPTNRLSMAGKGSSSDGWGKPGKSAARIAAEQQGEGGALALYAIGGLIAFGVTAGYLFFDDLPVHTYGPKKIFVNQMGGTNYHKFKKEFAKEKFEIVGVNLDAQPSELSRYFRSNPPQWLHLYEEGGLDSRLASEMGIFTLPVMLLIDERGRVVNRQIHGAQLEGEIKKLLK